MLAPIYIKIDSENRPTESYVLGTNLLFSLGILSVSEDVKIRGGDKEAGLAGPREATTSSVKLVKSERIPARCGVVLRLTVDTKVETGGSFYLRPCMSDSFLIEEEVVDVEGGRIEVVSVTLVR